MGEPLRDNQLDMPAPVDRRSFGIDDLAAVALTDEEKMVCEELRRQRDAGVGTSVVTPKGMEVIDRLYTRALGRRAFN